MSEPRPRPTETILVQGATGNVGFSTLTALLSPHLHPFNLKAGIRDLSKLDKVMALGPQIEFVQLDTQFPQSVHDAMKDVTKLVICPPSSKDRVEATKLIIQAAMDGDTVRHIVLISAIGADKCATPTQKQFHCIEQFLERSGVPFTILRCALFMEDFYMVAPHLVRGKLHLPLHSGCTAMVALKDVGECAATVLTSREAVHYGKRYNITGPELLDGPKMAANLSEGLSIPIEFVDRTDVEAYSALVALGCSSGKASGFVATFSLLHLGGAELVQQDSKLLLGYAPTSLSIWARDNYLSLMEVGQKRQSKLKISLSQATNEQGQQTTNEQGQQGAVQSWGETKQFDRDPLVSSAFDAL